MMSSPYNMAFACLSCRKSFKREFNMSEGCPKELTCPECGGASYNMGRHFKAPKKSDIKQWKKIEFLNENGFRFQKIRYGSKHHETVAYPESLEEARVFVEKFRKYAFKY